MKRIAIILLAVISVLSLCVMTACSQNQQEAKATAIAYLSGMPEETCLNQTPDYSDVKITVSYDDETQREVAYNSVDFVISFNNKNEAENVEVTISYKGFTCKTTINVVNKYEMDMVELPDFAVRYNAVKDSEFKDKTAPYYVGNFNEFLFVPVVTAYDINDEMVTFKNSGDLEFTAEVLLVEGDATSSIENSAEYYTYDGEKSAFLFTSAADGKTFRISVRPVELNEAQMEDVDNYTVSFDVTVKDGFYNAYKPSDLFVMENRAEMGNPTNRSEAQPMKNLKEKMGITFDCNQVKGIALQANIEYTKEDFPAEYFFTDGEVGGYKQFIGSLKDSRYLIYRELGESGKFAIEGNYCTINTENIPRVLVESNDEFTKKPSEVVAHTKLFYVRGSSQQNGTTNTESFKMNNINFIGNINRTDGDTTGEGEDFQAGGLIVIEVNGAKVDINNCIAKCWYITAFSSCTSDEHYVTINKCIFTDNYNSIFYIWGGIIDLFETDAYRAGGPVFIADHVSPGSKEEGREGGINGWISDIRVDDKSTVYSYVTGEEGWFKQMLATQLATQIKGMNAIFNAGGYTFIKTEGKKDLMNLIAIYKVANTYSAYDLFDTAIKGKGKFGANEFDMDGGSIDEFSSSVSGQGGTIGNSGMPIFYGSDRTSLIALNPSAQTIVAFQDDGFPDSLQIFKDNGGYLNALIGHEGKPGKLGVVFGDYHKMG